MTVRRLLAIAFIFCSSAVAWAILGGSVIHRSGGTESSLTPEVASLWGGAHAQAPPRLHFDVTRTVRETVEEERDGETVSRVVDRRVTRSHPLALASSRVRADLQLEHRRKGLLWYDTYAVDFAATYGAVVPEVPLEKSPAAGEVEDGGVVVLRFDFPSQQGLYDGFTLRLNGADVAAIEGLSEGLVLRHAGRPGDEITVEVAYRSRGLDTWRYLLGPAGIAEARDLDLEVTTDFAAVDFPPGGLSPTERSRSGEGWRLAWRFDRLVTAQDVGIDLPNRLNPGPLVARITFFAPISLLFFFTVLVVIGAQRRIDLHPVHYFFLSAAFFAFHLLLAYLVDHVNVHVAFVVSAAVSVALVGSYLAGVPKARGAVRLAVVSQAIYLVVFSYTFFFRGYTGLAVTVGSVVTLAILMRLTAATDWEEVFAAPQPAS